MAETKAKKQRGKRVKKKTEEAKPVPLPSLKEALKWHGLRVDDWNGTSLGRVSGLHIDAETDEPRWLIVKMGLFAGEAAIPFEHVAEAVGRIWVAYERDAIRKSPKLKATQTLNARQELQLCEHYGIGSSYGRAAELADHDDDAVSAVPATK